MEVCFTVIVVTLIQHKMAEGQHGIDDVEIPERGALRSVFDDSVISERIVVLKRSKAGHLGEIRRFIVDLTSTVRITSFYLKFETKLTA